MTDSTTMETYEASASDCIASKPPLISSRKPQHRKLHSRKSLFFHHRKLSYQKRRTKRIRESDDPELSSSDEVDPLPPPLTKNGFPNARFLLRMPRPSDIVPAIEDGSASDAGFNSRARQIHKRRKEAARIILASIGPRGNILPVPTWKRNRSGLSKYTAFMDPPQEDADLPNMRVPPPLLSRFYRGSLLVVHRVGQPRKKRKIETRYSESPEASAFECENLGISSQSDSEVIEQTGVKAEPVEILEEEDQPRSPDADGEKDSEMNPEGFSKAAFLEELEKVAGGSSDGLSEAEMETLRQNGRSEGRGSAEGNANAQESANAEGRGITESNASAGGGSVRENMFPAKPKGQNESTADVPNEGQKISKPKKRTEIDLFRSMLSLNPESLFEEQKPVDREVNVVKAVDIEQSVAEEEDERDTDLTEFQKDQRLSTLFTHNSTKRPRSKAIEMATRYLSPPKRRKYGVSKAGDSGGVEAAAPDARMNLKFTLKIMNKMGFTGRLGKKEDGRKDPVLPTVRSFRSGLGSSPAQTQTRKGDHSLLPTKFKGKPAGDNTQVGSSAVQLSLEDDDPPSKAAAFASPAKKTAEGGDVYTTRRKQRKSVPTDKPHPRDGSVGSNAHAPGAKQKTRASQLDENDIYETDDEEDGIDNGRRAILIDIDVLIKNSSKRWLNAIGKVLTDASLRANVKKLLESEPRDFCEADLLKYILGHANVKPQDMDNFEEKLDEAFESLPPPVLDNELLELLRQYSKEVHFGVFHRGSRRRLQYDLKSTGLNNSFLQEVCVTVKHDEKWPYIDTWQDLVCRVGVRSRQCLFILKETRPRPRKGDWRPSAGATAGACLGAKTAAWERAENGVKDHITSAAQEGQETTTSESSAQCKIRKALNDLIKDRMPLLKRRRVLGQFEDDLLWYSAVVLYEGTKDGKCLIKYNKFENTDWVLNEDLVSLCRRDFRKMKEMDFPGLLDPDASVL